MERIRLKFAEGVEFLSIRNRQFKTGLFTVTLAVPLDKDTATENALIPDVLYRGSRNFPNISSLSAAADRLYGAVIEVGVRQRGESQCIYFRCNFIDDSYALDGTNLLERSIALLGEILLNPVLEDGCFRKNYVYSERANLADRIRARINDKTGWSVIRLISEMCAGETFAIDKLGNEARALSITPEELWLRYCSLLKEARIIFYYHGSAAAERVEAAIRNVFAPLLTARSARYFCDVRAIPTGNIRELTESLDLTQGKLVMGFRTGGVVMGHPEFPALLVCNTLYGGMGTSRLFSQIREKMGLCYFISSALDKLKGIMLVVSGVDSSEMENAKQAIMGQLAELSRGMFTKNELEAAKRSVVSGILSRQDSQNFMEDDAVTDVICSGTWGDWRSLVQLVERVSAEQVAAAAAKIRLDMVYRLCSEGVILNGAD